jgi:hypothetical protein
MNFDKYPLDKAFQFIAGIVPGSAVIWMVYLRYPTWIVYIIYSPFLGYKTKLSIMLVLAFLIGNSITKLLARLAGAFGGAIGAISIGQSTQSTYDTAPWRDLRWRAAAKTYLGNIAPKDTFPMSESSFNLRLQLVQQTQGDQTDRTDQLIRERLEYSFDDSEWASWYRQFHFELLQTSQDDFVRYISGGLSTNMSATAISLLFGTIFVPCIRTAPLYLICSIFIVASTFTGIIELFQAIDYWSSLSKQIRFLSGK